MNVTIISDASHCAESKVGGYGFWAVSARGRHGGSGSFRKPLSGSWPAETMAIVNAIHIALRVGVAARGDSILIQTDAQMAIDALTGACKKPKRVEIREAVAEFRKLIAKHALTCEFRHVRGHTDVNDQRSKAQRNCDLRAKEGLRKARALAAAARGEARAKG